ncbi:MAG: adenosine deaminase [Rectinemataceae bacterium]|jgi:aminodeoxyfutalosine deaminase
MTALETLQAMPKTEVHLHLEGTISPESLWALAQRNGVALPVRSLAELRGMYVFEDFDKFIKLWLMMCSCLKTEADYIGMTDGFVAECRRQNIRYAEVHFTPYNHERFGIGAVKALDIVTKRLLEAEVTGGPVTRLITDIPSEFLAESGSFTAELLEKLDNPLIVAIGLGGPEKGFPRAVFAPWFERARRAGYPAVSHAGETGGAEHVREAVVDLKARRIQHGVRAVEDDSVLRLLAEREICCDVALTSNACLTPFIDMKTHPIRRLIEAGVPVTLSTDDPPFFGTDLVREYRRAHEEVGISLDQLWQINLNGLRFGLADVGLRRRLMKEFNAAGRSLGLGL